MTRDFSKNDFVIIVGGTNDIDGGSVAQIVDIMEDSISDVKATVTLLTIPYRYEKSYLNNTIYNINKSMLRVTKSKNVFLRIINKYITRRYLTKHGLDLRKKYSARTNKCLRVSNTDVSVFIAQHHQVNTEASSEPINSNDENNWGFFLLQFTRNKRVPIKGQREVQVVEVLGSWRGDFLDLFLYM